MLAVLFLAVVALAMWSVQGVLLRAAGLPVRIRIDGRGLPRRSQKISKTATNVIFAAALIAYPLCRGERPLEYYARLLPLGRHPLEMLHGFAIPVIYLAALYVAWIVTGQVHVRPIGGTGFEPANADRQDAGPTKPQGAGPAMRSALSPKHSGGRKMFSRVAAAPFMAIFGASVEELLFRGMLLAGLLESFPQAVAVPLGALAFAGAHYVRRVKRYWTFPGHVALGMMLCVAFACTRTLWLSMGLHAGGIFIIMGLRPLVRYVGPPWLVGASIFPYASISGIVGLGLLTLNIWLHYGAVH
jgi:membrane protease YdiL (CAAX protease family)